MLSFFALTGVGNAGFASSATKFVSKYNALNDNDGIKGIVETTLITVAITTIVMLLIIAFFITYFSKSLFTESEIAALNPLIPLVVVAFFVAIVGRVHLSVLDGFNQLHHRSYIGIISKTIFILTSVFTISRLGLQGLAIANLTQFAVSFILTSIYIKLQYKEINIFFPLFRMKFFKEIFNYGFNFQISSIFQTFIDPSVKFYLTSYGGMALVGVFEVVYKYFTQVRQLVVVAISAIVPTIANHQELDPLKIKGLFSKALSTLALTSTSLFLLALSGMPFYLYLIKLEPTPTTTGFSIIIYMGLLANLIGLTPFIFNLGTGDLKINTISSGVLALTCCVFGFVFGIIWGGYGVVLGWTVAQIIASFVLIIWYFRKDKQLKKKIIKQGTIIFALNVFFLVCIVVVLNFVGVDILWKVLFGVSVSLIYTFLALFLVPGFKNYKSYLTDSFSNVINIYAKR